jgi:dihydroorotate dehydrogenase (NAD+) catalytic subunit
LDYIFLGEGMELDISTEFCGLTISPAIMNASGIFSFVPVLRRLQDHFGALVTKSIGYREREGFENPVFAQLSEKEYINAVGLPNPGYRAMLEELIEAYPMRKPLIVSVFGASIAEMREMVREIQYACDAFEVNLSCPHPKPGEKVGMALGSDPLAVEAMVDAIKRSTRKPVIAKLSASIENLEGSVRACLGAGVDAISSTNTIGPVDSSNPKTKWPVLSNVKGGISGPAIKEKGLEAVGKIRELDKKIPIIGIGGISSGRDVVEYIKAGADAVAIGSAFDLLSSDNVGLFINRVVEEVKEEMVKEKVRDLRELGGRT